MRCPKCGFISFDYLDACKKCGADLRAVKESRGVWAAAGPPAVEPAVRTSAFEAPVAGLEAPAGDAMDALFGETLETGAPAGEVEAPSPPRTAAPPLAARAAVAGRPAGFWIRVAASLLDGLIMDVVFAGALAVNWFISGQGLLGVLGALPTLGKVFSAFAVMYSLFFWTWRGATPGKMALGLKIVMSDGSDIGFGRAVVRYVGYFISAILLGIGFLMIAFTQGKRGLHDKLADTQVVRL